MAKSMDNGRTWTDLGLIISPQHPDFLYYPVDITSGPIVEAGEYFYIYFADTIVEDGLRRDIGLAVARARVEDVVAAAVESNTAAEWFKYYEGAWEQSGLGGYSSPLERGNPPTGAFDIAFDETLQRYIGVISTQFDGSVNLYFIESLDGISWTMRRPVDLADGDSVYPTIVGLGADPSVTEGAFYVYFVDSGGWFASARWVNAPLVRRLISCEDPGS
jgi:hypothetical protein